MDWRRNFEVLEGGQIDVQCPDGVRVATVEALYQLFKARYEDEKK